MLALLRVRFSAFQAFRFSHFRFSAFQYFRQIPGPPFRSSTGAMLAYFLEGRATLARPSDRSHATGNPITWISAFPVFNLSVFLSICFRGSVGRLHLAFCLQERIHSTRAGREWGWVCCYVPLLNVADWIDKGTTLNHSRAEPSPHVFHFRKDVAPQDDVVATDSDADLRIALAPVEASGL